MWEKEKLLNKQILLFPQCFFYSYQRQKLSFLLHLICRLQMFTIWFDPKSCGNRLMHNNCFVSHTICTHFNFVSAAAKCTYSYFPENSLTSTMHNILFEPLAAFQYHRRQNNYKQFQRNESFCKDNPQLSQFFSILEAHLTIIQTHEIYMCKILTFFNKKLL